jgi:heterodisulfide reductase subunit B
MVKTDMSKYKVAPYYGCLLLKPQKEIGLDDPEDPVILHTFLDALGCQVVDFPAQVDCCGSYLVMREPEKVTKLSYDILAMANEYGAETLVTACPLCQSNLDQSQSDKVQFADIDDTPVLYFTQLLAVAFGLDTKTHQLEEHLIDPRPLFEAKDDAEHKNK